MLNKLFGRSRASNRAIVDALYGQIVAAARQPAFYAEWHVPDTPLGRFEMVGLHVFLFLHRMRDEQGGGRELAQGITDEFFRDVEHSLRELGIGDMGVPKRMKKLVRMFYGRVVAYAAAIEAGDRTALAEALKRNIVLNAEDWPESGEFASYVLAADQALADMPNETILAGSLDIPPPSSAKVRT